jgi:hypothetical protein
MTDLAGMPSYFWLTSPRMKTSARDGIPYTGEAMKQDLIRVRNAWDECQASRERDAIYTYLTAVFELVAWWAAERCAIERAHKALRLRHIIPFNWSIAASYDTARIFAGLGSGSSTASRSIVSRPRRTAYERARQQRGLSMILGMSVGAFTILHVFITLVAIGSGLIVVGGMFASNTLPVTTALFLFTTALTSLTGFLFPIHGFTPALGVGIVACVILTVALFALYKEHLVGAWRWIYVITAVVSLYLNVFVLVVQSFGKVSALNALAPMQTEPPFAVTQAAVLAIFMLIALIAVIKFRPPQAQM